MRKWSLDSCSPPVLISSTTPFSLLCLRLENIYIKLLFCSRGHLWCRAVSGEENERTVVIEQTSPLNSLLKSNLVLKYHSSFLHVPPGCRCSTLAHNFESSRNFQGAKGRPSSDEGSTLETSALQLFTVANLPFQLSG